MAHSISANLLRRAARIRSRWIIASGCALLIASGFYGCSAEFGRNSAPPSIADQLADGATIYTQTCATSTCHGTRGEGIHAGNSFSAWPLVGSIFQLRHPNAEIVFDVVRSGDERNLRALTDQQIYDAIAYELSQNGITLAAPLTSANAYSMFGGQMTGRGTADGLFPPSRDMRPAIARPHAALPLSAASGSLRMQVDEFAEAKSIAGTQPSAGGVYLLLVFVITDAGQTAIQVGPEHMTLTTSAGASVHPEAIDTHAAIERFHDQTIEPLHGTAALAIFALPAADQFQQLDYSEAGGNRLALNLKP